MSIRLRSLLGILAASATLTFAGLAHAVCYGNDFDPIGSLSFSGHALWSFDDGCQTPGFHSASASHLTLLSATVDTTAGPGNSGHLNFAPVSPVHSHLSDF